jgi:hypothetical protein
VTATGLHACSAIEKATMQCGFFALRRAQKVVADKLKRVRSIRIQPSHPNPADAQFFAPLALGPRFAPPSRLVCEP